MGDAGNGSRHLVALAESSDLEVAADRLRAVNPVAAAYVDTSISFVRGPGGAPRDRATHPALPRVPTDRHLDRGPATLPPRLASARVAVVSVYPETVDAPIAPFFEPQGVPIARIGTAHRATRMEHGDVSESSRAHGPVRAGGCGRGLDGPDVDAIFIPCTAVRTLEAIEPLEERIGKPVVTAIHATMWAVARLAGITGDAPLGGRPVRVPGLPSGAQ